MIEALVPMLTGRPLRFSVATPAADFLKIRFWPVVGPILMAPPRVEIVALPPLGAVIVSGLLPPPELMLIVEAPGAAMDELPAKLTDGVLMVNEAPLRTVQFPPRLIEPPVAWELILTEPRAPALKV